MELRNDEEEYVSRGKRIAADLIENRVKKRSRLTYDGKIKQATTWYKKFCPGEYDSENDTPKLPLDVDVWMMFLGSKETQINKGDHVKLKLVDGDVPGVVTKGSIRDSYDVTTEDGVRHRNVSQVNIISTNFVSFETLAAYRAAIGFLYTERGLTMDPILVSRMKQLLSGYSREVSCLKEEGKMDANEGKMPVTFLGYRMLAYAALGIGFAVDTVLRTLMYAHVYLVFQWNLMCRTANVSSSNYQHMWWEGDHLLVYTPKQKNDQTGAKAYPKAVYANPLDPIICPILALAMWVICCTPLRRDENNHRLFDGSFCDEKFGDWLLSILKALTSDQLRSLSLNILDVGTHSIRKGVATFLSNIVGGASMIAIFIRVGWSLGNVPNR